MTVINKWMKLHGSISTSDVLSSDKQANFHKYNRPCMALIREQKTLYAKKATFFNEKNPQGRPQRT